MAKRTAKTKCRKAMVVKARKAARAKRAVRTRKPVKAKRAVRTRRVSRTAQTKTVFRQPLVFLQDGFSSFKNYFK